MKLFARPLASNAYEILTKLHAVTAVKMAGHLREPATGNVNL